MSRIQCLFQCLRSSLTFRTWRWNLCLVKQPFCIQARYIWDLDAFAFSPVFIFCFVFLLCLINTFPSEEAKHSLCSVPLAADSDSREWGWAWGEREAESIFNHKDNSFSLTRPAAPERIWHLRGLSSVARVILIYLAIGTEGLGAASEMQGWDWVRDLWGREYRASKEEVIIYRQWWKDREQDSRTSFHKYYTKLPPGGLYSSEWGQVAQMGRVMVVPAA